MDLLLPFFFFLPLLLGVKYLGGCYKSHDGVDSPGAPCSDKPCLQRSGGVVRATCWAHASPVPARGPLVVPSVWVPGHTELPDLSSPLLRSCRGLPHR